MQMSGLENRYLKLLASLSPMISLQDWIFWNLRMMEAESTNISRRIAKSCNKDSSQRVLHSLPGEVPSARNRIMVSVASTLAHPLTPVSAAHQYQQHRQSSTRNLASTTVLRQRQCLTVRSPSSHKYDRQSNLRHCIMRLSTTTSI